MGIAYHTPGAAAHTAPPCRAGIAPEASAYACLAVVGYLRVSRQHCIASILRELPDPAVRVKGGPAQPASVHCAIRGPSLPDAPPSQDAWPILSFINVPILSAHRPHGGGVANRKLPRGHPEASLLPLFRR